MFKGKVVLVTGGTGTFGRAFTKRVLKEPVKKLIVLSRDELKQHEMQRSGEFSDPRMRYFLGDIRDAGRLRRAFKGVDIVVHAAALKQVPATEYNPAEAIKTNILGSQNVIEAALDCGVGKVLLVSSDKAVLPVNLYGATKMCAERAFIAANAYSDAKGPAFSVVRYGNVIGSRGSFIEMIRSLNGAAIPLTHAEMTRFWIRIDDVMNIVLDALSAMKGGEVFVPKMKNLSLAAVIDVLAPDSKIKMIGMRPGEKLHEVLLTEHEVKRGRDGGTFYVVRPEFSSADLRWLDRLPALSESLSYSSDNQKFKLTVAEAKKLFA